MEETTTAITAVKQEVQLRDWVAQIAAQQASGMTVQKWCGENGINPKTYYYHLRKIREKCVASAPAIVPLESPRRASSDYPGFSYKLFDIFKSVPERCQSHNL